MLFDMLEYYHMLKKNKVNILYSGPIWADGVEGIGRTLQKRLELDALPLSASQSIFSVFVEQMNNMLQYSGEKEYFDLAGGAQLAASTGVFLLGVQGKTYFLQSGNMMEGKHVDALKEKIDYLNTLDKIQLRKYYKEQIKQENGNPHSKGAGLGLIEIARRVTSKVEYKFTPVGDESVFFAMYVQIGE